jgi:PAS domain S-box-containing protein
MQSPTPARATVVDALDHIHDGVFVLDEEGRFIFVNPAAAKMLGFELSALLGEYIWARFPTAVGSLSHQA